MTITVTAEELAHYQDQCLLWHRCRLTYIMETKAQFGTVNWTPFLQCSREMQQVLLTKWDEQNPFPKLIPSV